MNKINIKWIVPDDMHGLRADHYLRTKVGRISRTKAQDIINANKFFVDEKNVRPSFKVKKGQSIRLIRPVKDSLNDLEKLSVKIIYEDDDIVVIDKPPHLAIHPNANCYFNTLTRWLLIHRGPHINPCHRIDKETSGLIVCAKNFHAESQIKQLFMNGLIDKTYLAIVAGHVKNALTINAPLKIQGEDGLVFIKMIKCKYGKKALTRIRPLLYNSKKNHSLLLCKPLTGRQHQIRAHLSIIGFPIIGDKLYYHGEEFFDKLCKNKDFNAELSHPRHTLHAARIRFRFKDKLYKFYSPLPDDIVPLLS